MYSGTQSVLPISDDNFREEKRKKILVRAISAESIYIVVCYFFLILFSTVELANMKIGLA